MNLVREREPATAGKQETDRITIAVPGHDRRAGIAARAEVSTKTANRDLIAETGHAATAEVYPDTSVAIRDSPNGQLRRAAALEDIHSDLARARFVADAEVAPTPAGTIDKLTPYPLVPSPAGGAIDKVRPAVEVNAHEPLKHSDAIPRILTAVRGTRL